MNQLSAASAARTPGRLRPRRVAGALLVAIVAALLGCAPALAATHNVYADNEYSDASAGTVDGSLQPFSLGSDGAPAALGSPVDAQGQNPTEMVVAPDGRHLYLNDGGPFVLPPIGLPSSTRGTPATGTLATFSVAGDGTASAQGSPVPTGGNNTTGLAMTPDGRELFAVNTNVLSSAGSVAAFTIGSDGTPSMVGTPVPSGGGLPGGVAVSPDGRHLYVVNSNTPLFAPAQPGTVVGYAINADGTLTPLAGSPVDTGGTSSIAAGFSPDGSHLYVLNGGSGDISVFAVGPDGGLTAQGSPVSTGGSAPERLVVAPDGRHLYVVDTGSDDVAVFSIAADGSLTLQGRVATTHPRPSGLAITPDGRHLYVSLYNMNVVILTSPARFAAGSRLATPSSGEVEAFAIDPSNGGLTAVGSPASTNGSFPQSVAVPPDQGPVAAFSAAPGPAGSATGFDGRASSDVDGSVVRWDWSFGDGSSAVDGGPTPSHVYAAPGTYTVTLTATDDAGCSLTVTSFGQMDYCNGGPAARTTRTVTVAAPAPVVAPSARRVLRLHVNPTRVFVHRRRCFRFTVTASGKRVAGALVRFHGHARRTNRRGQTTMCGSLGRVGLYAARATKAGARGATAHVRAVRRPAPPRPHFTG